MRKLSFLLIALVACFTFTRAEIIKRVKIGDLYYNLDTENKTAEVTSQNSGYPYWSTKISTADIPSSVPYNEENYSVTSIGNGAFRACSDLTSMTLPTTVTSIGEEAFYECSGLESIEIPNSVTSIGNGAFGSCSGLTSVTIPNSVTSIGYIFYWCGALTNLSVAADNPNYCSVDNVLFNKDQTTLLYYSAGKSAVSYSIPNTVTSIREDAFNCCIKLTSIDIPNSVTSIGDGAFYLCRGLTSITIPNGVKSIGELTFYSCTSLKSIEIPNSVTSIGDRAFGSCSGLTEPVYNAHVFAVMPKSRSGSYTISDGIETIANSAFEGCTDIISVSIPNSVTSIGEGAFKGCSGLTSVTIPSSVTSIGEGAFKGCSGLTSVTIPSSVTSIGDDAFINCSSLTSVTLNSNAVASKDYNYYSSLKDIFGSQVTKYIIGNSVTEIGSYAFYKCSGLTTITLGNGVTSIGDNACSYCTGLTSVTIPGSVTSIGDWAFYECFGLTYVDFPNSVTSIGDYPFGYTGLSEPVFNSHIFVYMPTSYSGSYDIPDGIKTIANYAFVRCTDLTSVTIPNSVTSIGKHAFEDCSGLTSVTIPGNVTSIGNDAFEYCTGLTSIICKAVNLPTLGVGVFFGVSKTIPLYVPDGKESAYNDADQWKEFDIKPISAIPTGMESVQTSDVRSQKLLRNGHLIIKRDGKVYNVMGGEVR